MLGVVGVVGVLAGGQAVATQGNIDNITFCHRTNSVTNPYRVITTDPASIIKSIIKAGHDGHDGSIFDGTKDKTKWGDIIPAFDYPKIGKKPAGHFDGLNVSAVNVPAGEAWLARHCAPAPDLTLTHLTLVKVVVNDGGGEADARDWTLKADGPTDLSGKTGETAVTKASIEPGSYTLKESGGPSGYEASPWSCTATEVTKDGAVTLAETAGAVTLNKGDEVTCTITNSFKRHDTDKRAHLTLVKKVVNDGGGKAHASDWTLKADGETDLSGKTGETAVTNASVEPGKYTLKESGGPSGYEASPWSCTDKTVTKDDAVTLAEGDSVTCTITNTFKRHDTDKRAHLTLVKNVVNDGGGAAVATGWTLKAVGPVTISGTSGSPAVTNAEVTAGDFKLSESDGPSGYVGSAWSCSEKTVTAGVVKLTKDDSVTCTITNTFQGRPTDNSVHLTLVKKVVNGHGGTALATRWTLKAAGSVTISGTSGSSAVTGAVVPAGDFTLSESGGPSGYTASAWSCSEKRVTASAVSLAAGESVTCTITNTQNAAPESVQVLGVSETAQGVSGTAQGVSGTAKAGAGAPKSLAFTGPAAILPLGLVGIFALALGGVLTAVARRRVRS